MGFLFYPDKSQVRSASGNQTSHFMRLLGKRAHTKFVFDQKRRRRSRKVRTRRRKRKVRRRRRRRRAWDSERNGFTSRMETSSVFGNLHREKPAVAPPLSHSTSFQSSFPQPAEHLL